MVLSWSTFSKSFEKFWCFALQRATLGCFWSVFGQKWYPKCDCCNKKLTPQKLWVCLKPQPEKISSYLWPCEGHRRKTSVGNLRAAPKNEKIWHFLGIFFDFFATVNTPGPGTFKCRGRGRGRVCHDGAGDGAGCITPMTGPGPGVPKSAGAGVGAGHPSDPCSPCPSHSTFSLSLIRI